MLLVSKLGAVTLAFFLSVQSVHASDAPDDGGSGGSNGGVSGSTSASNAGGGQRAYGNRRPSRAAQEQAATAQGLVLSDDICNGGKYDPCGDDAGRVENR